LRGPSQDRLGTSGGANFLLDHYWDARSEIVAEAEKVGFNGSVCVTAGQTTRPDSRSGAVITARKRPRATTTSGTREQLGDKKTNPVIPTRRGLALPSSASLGSRSVRFRSASRLAHPQQGQTVSGQCPVGGCGRRHEAPDEARGLGAMVPFEGRSASVAPPLDGEMDTLIRSMQRRLAKLETAQETVNLNARTSMTAELEKVRRHREEQTVHVAIVVHQEIVAFREHCALHDQFVQEIAEHMATVEDRFSRLLAVVMDLWEMASSRWEKSQELDRNVGALTEHLSRLLEAWRTSLG
jgi:hypothetical protein